MTCIAGVFGAPLLPETEDYRDLLDAAALRASNPLSVVHWDNGALLQGRRRHQVAPKAGTADRSTLGLAIACTGRLTNGAALAHELGIAAGSYDDAALIAHAYRAWGTDAIRRLEGRFSLILWDQRAQLGLCARDRLGQSPLYYSLQADRLYLASDVQMMFGFSDVSREVNQTSLYRYLKGMPPADAETYFSAIKRLPAGNFMIWQQGRIQLQTYWKQPLDIAYSSLSFAQQVETFKALLDKSIEPSFDASSAPIFFLSGGLDSSSITAAARRLLNAPKLQAISMILSEDPRMNEQKDQQAVAAIGGIEVTEIDGSKIDYLASLDQILFEQAGPTLGAGMGLSFHTYLTAERLGADVVFDGHGGDETVSYGGGRLHELRRDRRWLALFYELLRVDPKTGAASILKLISKAPPLSYVRNGFKRVFPGTEVSTADQAGTSFLAPNEAFDLGVSPPHHVDTLYPERIEQTNHLTIVSDPLQAYAFETLDNLAGRRKIQMQYPLWDHELVAFCLSLPPDSKLRHGYDRYILREAMRGVLPESVRTKKAKCDFSGTALKSVRRDRRAEMDHLFKDRLPQLSDLVDLEKAAYVYDNFCDEDTKANTGFLMQSIWKLTSISKWIADPTGRTFRKSNRATGYDTISSTLTQDGSYDL
ncbi:MAG: asparagine synthetase B family protein [Aquidulcibacter sp.]